MLCDRDTLAEHYTSLAGTAKDYVETEETAKQPGPVRKSPTFPKSLDQPKSITGRPVTYIVDRTSSRAYLPGSMVSDPEGELWSTFHKKAIGQRQVPGDLPNNIRSISIASPLQRHYGEITGRRVSLEFDIQALGWPSESQGY